MESDNNVAEIYEKLCRASECSFEFSSTQSCMQTFYNSCRDGSIDEVIWIYSKYKHKLHRILPYSFQLCVESQHVQLVQWFAPNVHIDDSLPLFQHACLSGNLEMAKIIRSKLDNIDDKANQINDIFIQISVKHINVARWFYNEFSFFIDLQTAFTQSFDKINLQTLQMLHSLSPNLKLSKNAFYGALIKKFYYVITWWIQEHPYIYLEYLGYSYRNIIHAHPIIREQCNKIFLTLMRYLPDKMQKEFHDYCHTNNYVSLLPIFTKIKKLQSENLL